jgi:hypothetical protein
MEKSSIRRDAAPYGCFFYDAALDGRFLVRRQAAAPAIRLTSMLQPTRMPPGDDNAFAADDDHHEFIYQQRSKRQLEPKAGRLKEKAKGAPDSLLSAATTQQNDDYAD